MTFENIVLQKHEPGITVLKINRPAALNALNLQTLEELNLAVKEISADDSVRVLVLTGEGKAFIAGADITEMKDLDSGAGIHFSRRGHEVARILETMPKPTIAAVNGFALGGGTEMAIACDFILASESAVFGQPEVGLGIIPGFGGCFRLARFVGYPMAKELIFSGRRVKAAEALSLGLCNHVFPSEGFLEKALEVARAISQQSASAVSRAKTLMVEFSESQGLSLKADAEAQAFGWLMGSHDQREGMTAFTEKRKPKFGGLDS